MSHSHKDAVGGHVGTWIDVGHCGVVNNGPIGRRFAKKWNKREARREAHATITQALIDLEDERAWRLEEQDRLDQEEQEYELLSAMYEDEYGNGDYYDMIAEDEWEREQQQAEADKYDMLYGSYYDDYDYGWDAGGWFTDRSREHDEFQRERFVNPALDLSADSGESLGDILARHMVEGTRIGEAE